MIATPRNLHATHKTIFLVLFLFFVYSSAVKAEEAKICPFDKEFETPRQMYGYRVQITSNPKDDLGHPCRLTVQTLAGAPILTATEHGIGWVRASADMDFDGDGKPDLLFEGWTGGAHCCFRYWLITSGSKPNIWEFFDFDPFVVEWKPGGGIATFRAWDGAFDYFESSYAGSPLPEILFTIEGNKINIITAGDAALCSKELPKELTPDAIQHFRSTAKRARDVRNADPQLSDLYTDDHDTMHTILRFVIQQIYCGNEQGALENLRNMWPDFDYSRIRKAILHAYRKESVLRDLKAATPFQSPVTRSLWNGKDQ